MKLLSYRLRKQQAEYTIHKIQNPESGKSEPGLDKKKESFEKYYKSLYSQTQTDDDPQIDTFLAKVNLPSITEEQNQKLVAEISKKELYSAIRRLKTGKSLGLDGFSHDWYKSMQEYLCETLLKTFNWVLKEGEIPPSWKDAINTVIPKDGKDKMEYGNYRPISIYQYTVYKYIITRLNEGPYSVYVPKHTQQGGKRLKIHWPKGSH